MLSRSEKYRSRVESDEARSSRNKNLYSEVYNADFYTEIAELENTNEVDLSKIKELLKNREEYQKAKNYKDILQMKDEEKYLDVMIDEEEEKVYDVNSIIEKAKSERRETENYKRTTEYDVLKKLNLLSIEEKAKGMLETNKREEEKLRELIDTITMKKDEILEATDGYDFLSELRGETTVLKGNNSHFSGDTTVIDDEEFIPKNNTLVGSMVVVDNKRPVNLEDSIDRSFFTTSLSLSKNDFEDFRDINKKSSHSLVVKFLLTLLVGIVLAIGFLVFNTYINV